MLIKNLVGIKNTYTDHVGLEFEIEGVNIPNNVPGWRVENDGSLRGESHEYVLPEPCHINELDDKIKLIRKAFDKSKVYNSGYAGTHVHINVGDLTYTQLFNFALLYLSMEDLISRRFGDTRQGNLFCLRMSDAEWLGKLLYDVVKTEDLKLLNTDNIRYASINFNALFRYGSLEFRGWRGDGDFEAAAEWAKFLMSLKDKARTIISPVTLLMMSSETQGAFAEEWFPNMTDEDRQTVMRGVRRIQHIAFEGDW